MTFRPAIFLPLLTAALAVWVTRGTLAMAHADGERVGALPSALELATVVLLVAAIALVVRPSPERVRPLYVTGLLLLPWIPLPIPPAALLWTGTGMTLLVWFAVALCVAATVSWRGVPHGLRSALFRPQRAPVIATCIAFALFLAAVNWRAPSILGGDQPHYLIVAQSLLHDGDLRIENNHARRDYAAYVDGTLKPDFLRRGRDGQIYSVHAPGLPLLIAPAYALGGYRGVAMWLAAIAALAGALVWRLAWRATESAATAWIAWAATVLTPPFFFHAFTVYPDAPAAALALVGLTGIQGASLLLAGSALACLPWLHTRYVVIAAMLGAAIVWQRRRDRRALLLFSVLPVVSALLWFGFFYSIYGSISPASPYGGYTQTSPAFILTGLPGLFFDQQFGILPHAPVYVAAIVGLRIMWRRTRFVALTIALVVAAYLAVVGAYRMWWGGWSAPARFVVPIVLLLGLPLASVWRNGGARWRAVAGGALFLSLFATGVLAVAEHGALLYNLRTGTALWLEWLGVLVDLAAGAPSFIRDTRWIAIGHTVVWLVEIAIALAAWSTLAQRRQWDAAQRAVTLTVAIAAALMAATTSIWALRRVDPVAPSAAQVALLRRVAADRSLFVELSPRRLSRADLLAAVRIGPTGGRGNDLELLRVKGLPAGRYRVHVAGRKAVSGRLEAHVGRPLAGIPPFAAQELQRQPPGPTPFEIDLPVDAGLLTVTGDDAARGAISELSLEPVVVRPPASFVAIAAAPYGPALVMIESTRRVYLEPTGLWLGPGERASFAIQSPTGPVRLLLRNAPTANRVTIQLPSGEKRLTLQPGETWITPEIEASSAVAVSLQADSGFKPSDQDEHSGDSRLLAIWLSVVPAGQIPNGGNQPG